MRTEKEIKTEIKKLRKLCKESMDEVYIGKKWGLEWVLNETKNNY